MRKTKMIDPKNFYNKVFDMNMPHTHQIQLWNAFVEYEFPIMLKAPTGSGKTEATIASFLYQFIEKNFFIALRMIYVLPMRVLVNSVAERIKRYARKIYLYIYTEVQHGDIPNVSILIASILFTTLDQFLYSFAWAKK